MNGSGGRDGLTLGELARELPGGARVVGDEDARVTGVRHDSRAVEPGDLFVARKGAKADGAKFVLDAIARGAAAIAVEAGVDLGTSVAIPRLEVADAAEALAWAAASVYGHPAFGLEIVGITGTNGKTTTTHLVRAAIDAAEGKRACGIIGTVGHSFGDWAVDASHTTPEADELARVFGAMRAHGASHVAMEVSSIALAAKRVAAVRFRVAALTNLTQDHLDYHGSMEAYADAKALLFTKLAPGGAVLNVDDAFGASLVGRVRAPLVRVSARLGAKPVEAEVAPRSVTMSARGIDAVLRTPRGDVTIRSRLVGAHNLENIVLALGIAHALDLDLPRAAKGIEQEAGAPGRLERCDGDGDDVVALVDYAHTPDALARVLDSVRSVAGRRVWCVFGCGGDRDSSKRAPMGEAVARRADVAIVTSDNPRGEAPDAIARPVAQGARSGGMRELDLASIARGERGYLVELDRRRAIEAAVLEASPGDVVLVAGKGHEDYQIVGAEKRHFDDREEARRALGLRRAREAKRASMPSVPGPTGSRLVATPVPPNRAELTAWSAAAATGGAIARIRGEGARAVGVTTDSRAVEPGGTFVALRGETHDGHDYLGDAIARGASLLVVARGHRREIADGPDVVEVDDTLEAWGALAAAHLRAWRRAPRSEPPRVVAITGSAGKTTTKELCASLLGAVGGTHASAGNLNNRVGLPAVVLGLEPSHRFAVLEMGMSVRGEIAALARIAPPDIAVVTNVDVAHAQGVGGSRGDVAREKGALYAALEPSGVAIANADDAAVLGELARTRAARVETFGRTAGASYRLVQRESLAESGSNVILERSMRAGPLAARVPLVGEAAAIDFAAAVAVTEVASGWTLTTGVVREALATLRVPEGRAQVRVLADGVVVLDDAYNANPASVRAAIDTLVELARERGGARAVAVLGEMRELGDRSEGEHAAIGEALASAQVALAVSCGGQAALAIARAAAAGVQVVDAPDVAHATRAVLERVRGGDVVLVKASRSVGADAIVRALLERAGGAS